MKRAQGRKCLAKIKTQRIKTPNATKRVLCRAKWKEDMDSNYAFDPRKVWRAGEKIFRIGEVKGGEVWVGEVAKQNEVAPDIITRGGGAWRGGPSTMVCLGARYCGVCHVQFVAQKERLNSEAYLRVLGNYNVDCGEVLCGNGVADYTFQRDGAPCHASNITQGRRAANFPRIIPKNGWRPNSPNMNPFDFFVWAELQHRVDAKAPNDLVSLKVAIRRAAAGFELDTLQRAIDGFYERRHLAIEVEGKAFKHMLRRKDLPKTPARPGKAGEPDQPLADMRVNEGFEEEMDAEINEEETNEQD